MHEDVLVLARENCATETLAQAAPYNFDRWSALIAVDGEECVAVTGVVDHVDVPPVRLIAQQADVPGQQVVAQSFAASGRTEDYCFRAPETS